MNIITQVKSVIRRVIRPPLHKKDVSLPYVFLGSDYGGWPILRDTEQGAVIYSFGVGRDISFDLGAIKKYRCTVHAFDPTPKSIEWINRQDLPDTFIFHPIGLAAKDGTGKFYPPANPEHVSFSERVEGDNTSGFILADVLRLRTILDQLKTDRLDILKMDIEGFEYDVIQDFLADEIRPHQVLVEYHHGMYGIDDSKTLDSVNYMRKAGYKIFYVSSSGHEYGFVLS